MNYYYLAFIRHKDRDEILSSSNTVEISTPDIALDELTESIILVNKKLYYLEIQNSGKTAKRYLLSLGRDPFLRKLHQDILEGKHGNTQVPKLIGSVDRYAYTGSTDDILASIDPEDGRTCYIMPVGRGVQHEDRGQFAAIFPFTPSCLCPTGRDAARTGF